VFQLLFAPGPLNDETTNAFLTACSQFYDQKLPDCATSVSCALSNRRLRHINHRLLQPMDIIVPVDVTAIYDSTCDSTGYEDIILKMAQSNSNELETILQSSSNVNVQTYYESIQIEALPLDATFPTTAPIVTPAPVLLGNSPPTSLIPIGGMVMNMNQMGMNMNNGGTGTGGGNAMGMGNNLMNEGQGMNMRMRKRLRMRMRRNMNRGNTNNNNISVPIASVPISAPSPSPILQQLFYGSRLPKSTLVPTTTTPPPKKSMTMKSNPKDDQSISVLLRPVVSDTWVRFRNQFLHH
jgi:hypothetical protein